MTTQPKPFPILATKAEIRRIYYKLPIRTVNAAIKYAILRVNKEGNIKHSLHGRILTSKHIAIIKDELGDAPGYETVE